MENNVKNIHDAIEANIVSCEWKRDFMLQETQSIYDRVLSKLNKEFIEIQEGAKIQYTKNVSVLQKYKESLNSTVCKLESSSDEAQRFKERPMDPKLFLQIQKHTTDFNQICEEIRGFVNSSHLVTPSFELSNFVRYILSEAFKFGSISMKETKFEANIEDVAFPSFLLQPVDGTPTQKAHTATLKCPDDLKSKNKTGEKKVEESGAQIASEPPIYPVEIKAVEQASYSIKDTNDELFCFVSGMAVTKDKNIIIADRVNCKIKMFTEEAPFFGSKTLKLLSCVTVPQQPFDVTVVNDKESVVTTDSMELVILDMEKQMVIKSSVQLDFDVKGITSYDDKLIVTCPTKDLPSVKMIDKAGKIYWSVSTNVQGEGLFKEPNYVSVWNNGVKISTVIVSDSLKNTLTLLKVETGEITATRQLNEKSKPRAVCVDKSGIIFVCNLGTHQVSVLSPDLSEEIALVSLDYAQVVEYNIASDQLIVACSSDKELITIFQISKTIQDNVQK